MKVPFLGNKCYINIDINYFLERDFYMIQKSDILTLHFFDYKMSFTGSCQKMRYRITKVEHEIEEGIKEAKLLATIWFGPYAYDHTDDSEKISEEFSFTMEGKDALVDWLNEQYSQKCF